MRTQTLLAAITIGLIGTAVGCDRTTDLGQDLPFEDEGQASLDGIPTKGTYEYVIVGSGAGGGPLAANLAWNGHSVLLLEAGVDKTGERDYKVPAFHTQSTENAGMRWDYMVRHYADQAQAMRDDKTTNGDIFYPRAGTLGGCTAHNAMITIYPHDADWNDIVRTTGDQSWRPDLMRSYFARLENNKYASDMTGHGNKGWLQTEYPDASIAVGSVAWFATTGQFTPFRLSDQRLLHTVMAGALEFSHQGDESFLQAIGNDVTVFLPELLGLMTRDINNASAGRDQAEGLFTVPLATRNGKRNSTAEVIKFVRDHGPKCKRPDGVSGQCLEVRFSSLATKVLYAEQADPGATPIVNGVEYLNGGVYRADRQPNFHATGSTERAKATREVVLAAGAFNTPQLLKQSGLGPERELNSFGIEARVNKGHGGLPAVGTNLQDRYEMPVISKTGEALRAFEGCSFGLGGDDCLNQLKLDRPDQKGTGAYTSNGAIVGMLKRSSTLAPSDPTDLFVFGLAGYFPGYKLDYSKEGFDPANARDSISWLVLKAHSRNAAGTVVLRPHDGRDPSSCSPQNPCSYDPRDTPIINFNSFGGGDPLQLPLDDPNRKDLEAVVDGLETIMNIGKRTRKMLGESALTQVYPNPASATGVDADGNPEFTRDDLRRFARDNAWGHHASCTAPMGADNDLEHSVVDSKFRVHGTKGLRIVDASIFPKIPGVFVVVPVYMISEKASDQLLGELHETVKPRPELPAE